MERERVSVIIPVYNAEAFLEKCILGVVSQTYKALEIILVDDASPDRSPEICDEWARKDSRIKVIHKKNEGAGMARNTGMEHATGEYICFFDADDTMEADTIETCLRAALQNDAEIVCFGHDRVTTSGETTKVYCPKPPKFIFEGEEVQQELLPLMLFNNLQTENAPNLFLSFWSCFFSTALLRRANWRIVSERELVSEDTYSLTQLYRHVNKVVVLDRVFYHYTVNPTSLSQTFRKEYLTKLLSFYDKLSALTGEFNAPECLKSGTAAAFLALAIANMKQLVSSNDGIREKRKLLAHFLKADGMKRALRECEIARLNRKKRLLFRCMQSRSALLTYLFVWLRNKKD